MCSLQMCACVLTFFSTFRFIKDGQTLPRLRSRPSQGRPPRRCATCLGRDHAEGALSGKGPACRICASLPLARATRRLAFWKGKDAEETALVPSGADAPVGMSASSALDLVSVSSRLAAAAPPPGLSPSPPPVSPGAAGSEAEELQPSGVQAIPHD